MYLCAVLPLSLPAAVFHSLCVFAPFHRVQMARFIACSHYTDKRLPLLCRSAVFFTFLVLTGKILFFKIASAGVSEDPVLHSLKSDQVVV